MGLNSLTISQDETVGPHKNGMVCARLCHTLWFVIVCHLVAALLD